MGVKECRSDGVISLHHYNLENNIFQVKSDLENSPKKISTLIG